MKRRWSARQIWTYTGLLAGCLAIAIITDWTSLAAPLDNQAYDLIYRMFPPRDWPPSSAILAIDEATFNAHGGVRNLRGILTESLQALESAKPLAIAIDVTLPDAGDATEDARLAAVIAQAGNVVLSSQLANGTWEDPLPLFRSTAKALGHVHPEENHSDGVGRKVPLEYAANRERRWALMLEAYRVSRQASTIVESTEDLQVGETVVPVRKDGKGRLMWIRHRPGGIPTVSLAELKSSPKKAAVFAGRTVFIGVTALAGRRDQVLSPFTGDYVSGVVIHAQAFETIAQRRFVTEASNVTVLFVCFALVAAVGAVFAFLYGWMAYVAAFVLLAAAHAIPIWFFHFDTVFPYFAVFASAWLAAVCAASYQHFIMRRQLQVTQGEKERYQQAIQWVAHEMRSPLTAIQGSSEMMGRYALTDERRKQMASMIHAESKRMARMIQTFLDVERLSEGQMDMKRVPFELGPVVELCVQRIAPLAERKQITVHCEGPMAGEVTGDRELMEYAVYNLLTNAVKYSPTETHVRVTSASQRGMLRLSVADQGIGMDKKEVENIFRKFYRTEKAQKSGEVGTGIGLSIVEQIVTHHGGKIEVLSTPGKGSVFTIAVPLAAEPATAADSLPQQA